MRLEAFRDMVRRQAAEVPTEYLDGVLEVTVSARTLPHPVREGIFTLGECVPVPVQDDSADGVQSRVVLYHGSFAALAQQSSDFDWSAEAWETLTHELRHHVEWRARVPDLEAFDWAAEQNFARADGEAFDPAFYRDGESVEQGLYRIDDDYFVEETVRSIPATVRFAWHGQDWLVHVPAQATPPAFLVVDGVTNPPPGDLVLVLRRRARVQDLLRRRPPVFQAVVDAVPAPGEPG
jgi:hypothetical protein